MKKNKLILIIGSIILLIGIVIICLFALKKNPNNDNNVSNPLNDELFTQGNNIIEQINKLRNVRSEVMQRYIENTKNIKEGSFVLCQITEVKDYDLVGKLLN